MNGEDDVKVTGRRAQGAASKQRAKAPAKGGRAKPARAQGEPGQVDRVFVTDGALAKVVGLSAHEVPGVVGMAPASLGEGIRRILGARQVDEGVVVTRHEDPGVADVDIHVVVAYGVNIPVVADSIRERVRYAASTFAGVELDKIRVHVAGVSRA